MNIFIDIVIFLIAGITVFFAGKRGFVATVIDAAGTLVSLIAVICFTGPISDLLAATPLGDLFREAGIKALSIVLIFVLVNLFMKLFGKTLTSLLGKLPFFKKANTFLGILVGLVVASIRILLFCAAVNLISTVAALLQIDFLTVDAGSTVLYRFFDGIQILKFLF